MRLRDPTGWMCGEALELLERADRLHRQFFQLGHHRNQCPTWEPPVDIFETDRELVVFVALPGVAAEQLEIVIDGTAVIIAGRRVMPAICRNATIHRLEIPYGRFERRIELPPAQFQLEQKSLQDGCLFLTFIRIG